MGSAFNDHRRSCAGFGLIVRFSLVVALLQCAALVAGAVLPSSLERQLRALSPITRGANVDRVVVPLPKSVKTVADAVCAKSLELYLATSPIGARV